MARNNDFLRGDVGAPSAAVESIVERGDRSHHTTVLTVNSVLPAIAGGASLGVGKLVYTFPAGAIIVRGAYMAMSIQQVDGHITADTPDVGLGTTIASGANALLSSVGAAAENILTGQTAADCDGSATTKTVDAALVIEAGGDHTVYFNVADGWAASGDAGALIRGKIILDWSFLSA